MTTEARDRQSLTWQDNQVADIAVCVFKQTEGGDLDPTLGPPTEVIEAGEDALVPGVSGEGLLPIAELDLRHVRGEEVRLLFLDPLETQ